jgi:hypothetical protein
MKSIYSGIEQATHSNLPVDKVLIIFNVGKYQKIDKGNE